jgi:hypothetical protein
LALALLGRWEEANSVATKRAADGEGVSTYIHVKVMAGEYVEAIRFFESRWPDFAAFESDYPPSRFTAFPAYADLAQAYSATGNEERFRQALARLRAQLDTIAKIGLEFSDLNIWEAMYFNLAGDPQSALTNLALAVDKGYLGYPRMSTEWVQLKPLEGDPEYEAIQARMVEHLHAERAKLNLGPMSI